MIFLPKVRNLPKIFLISFENVRIDSYTLFSASNNPVERRTNPQTNQVINQTNSFSVILQGRDKVILCDTTHHFIGVCASQNEKNS